MRPKVKLAFGYQFNIVIKLAVFHKNQATSGFSSIICPRVLTTMRVMGS